MVSRMHSPTQVSATDKTSSPLSTLAFDWVYTLLVFLVTIGIYLDGWSHSSFGPDQSVFSEYHLLFYSALASIGLWLFAVTLTNRRQGYVGLNALPAGYKISALGLLIFGLTGGVDLFGHALFGFEVDIEALYSPTHIGLFVGWVMISIGPARAALHRQRDTAEAPQSWLASVRQQLPMLLAWISFYNILTFTAMSYLATSNPVMLLSDRPGSDYYGQLMGIMGIIIQTAMTVGPLAWLMLRFRLALGSFTLFLSSYALFYGILDFSLELLPVFFVVGVIADILYVWLKPGPTRQWQFHLFNVLLALALWACLYGAVFLTNVGGGVWYTPYIWMGTITQGITTALLLSLLATSGCPDTAAPS